MNIQQILQFHIVEINDTSVTLGTVFVILCILISARLLLFFIKKALYRKAFADEQQMGNTYALFQIIKYGVWVTTIALILDSSGLDLTVLLAGSAALLVGIGLGLQQTFNDIVSGIILLSERSIRLGDILEIDDDVVKIEEVGVRTSKCMNRQGITIIIPNSLITTNKVINWSHQSKQTRFFINVGVAYGSDVDLVVKTLKESATEHPDVSMDDNIEVRLIEFGSSSLDFQLLFMSSNIFRIEKVKSDIRMTIDRKFRANNICIPFPQLDIHRK